MANDRDYIEWDIANWSKSLTYWIDNSHVNLQGSRALELGGRHGGLSLWLAQQGASVVCTDLTGPSELAREKHRKFGVENRIEYASANALDLSYQDEFDLVIFKSILGGIGEDVGEHNSLSNQALAIANMHNALKPGGELLFAENLSASPIHQFLRRQAVPWAQSWNYPALAELRKHFSVFSEISLSTAGFAGAFGRSETQRSVLGLIDTLLFDRILPEKYHYIAFGVARK